MTPLLLPLCAVCLAVGATLGAVIEVRPAPVLVVSSMLLALALVIARRSALLCLAGVTLAAVSCGAVLSTVALRRSRPDCHVGHLADGRTTWRLAARVAGDPVASRHGSRVLLAAQWLMGPGGRGLCGNVELHLDGPLPLVRGDAVVVRTRLRPALGSRNPGTAGSRLRYLSEDIGAVGFGGEGTVVVHERARPTHVRRVQGRVRALLRRAAEPGPSRQILGALVLGDRAAIDPAVRRDFARAGVSHLLAVSGLHLTLLAGGVLWLLRWLLLRIPWLARRTDVRWLAAPFAALSALTYTQLTGGAPSTTRACIMVCACLTGLCLSRAPDLARPLALAAIVLLALDPLDLLRPGFQLSFLAVVGIGLVALRRPRRGPLAAIRGLCLVTAVATAITAPVVAFHFHEVSVVGLLTNLVAIPATTFVLLPLALTGTGLGLLWPGLGEVLLGLAAWCAGQLHGLCAAVAGLDHAALRWSPGALLAAAATTVVVAALVRGRWPRRLLLLVAAALLFWWGADHLWRRLSPRLAVTFLDVGQGDSAFVQLPGGATLLVDAGGSYSGRWDPGEARVVPFLRSRGVRRLDLVVASHPHPDHVGGLRAVLEAFPVQELWICWHGEPSPWLEPLRAVARRRGVRIAAPRVRRLGDATLRPLWPHGRDTCADPAYSANDNSIVLRLEWRQAAVLFTGDIEQGAEQELLRRSGSGLRAALLKVPHHGSATSSSIGLLRAVSPRLAVISCGAGNSFGFPDATVLERLRRVGATTLRIDRLGAVVVELRPDGSTSWSAPVH